MAQKVYANKQYELSDAFKYDTEVYFDAEAQNLDFSQPAAAAKAINDWVRKTYRDWYVLDKGKKKELYH